MRRVTAFLIFFAAAFSLQAQWHQGPSGREPVASSRQIQVGGATIQIDIGQQPLDVPASAIVQWVQRAAEAVTAYYGRFPVPRARVFVLSIPGRDGVLQGTTWGDMGGFPGFTRMRLGQHTSESTLAGDWTMTHEFTHLAFPNLPDNQSWMEEGLATYIEPIARVQSGQLTAARIWADMMHDMPKGEPADGDTGLDSTHTWGRTYWGGAMFCLIADVAIRRQTNNRKGLQDALRAILLQGGTIEADWGLPRALAIGDRATGTTVLTTQYRQWSGSPSPIDLAALWKALGIRRGATGIDFDASAPDAKIREAITAPMPASPTK